MPYPNKAPLLNRIGRRYNLARYGYGINDGFDGIASKPSLKKRQRFIIALPIRVG
ncbi:hypothetical protein GCM10009022_22930 [Vreelandella titanicae]